MTQSENARADLKNGMSIRDVMKKYGKSQAWVYKQKNAMQAPTSAPITGATHNPTTQAAPLNKEGGGLDAALNAARNTDDKPPVSSQQQQAPAGAWTAEGIVALAETINTITCKIYCATNAIRLEPEIERQLQFTNAEKESLKGFAPCVVPYMNKMGENSPLIGVGMFCITFVAIEAQRVAVMKKFKPKKKTNEEVVEGVIGTASSNSPSRPTSAASSPNPDSTPSEERVLNPAAREDVNKFFPTNGPNHDLSDSGLRFNNENFPTP